MRRGVPWGIREDWETSTLLKNTEVITRASPEARGSRNALIDTVPPRSLPGGAALSPGFRPLQGKALELRRHGLRRLTAASTVSAGGA